MPFITDVENDEDTPRVVTGNPIAQFHRMGNYFKCLAMAGVLFSAMAGAGCTVRARYYDAPHSDYHRWSAVEVEPYRRWETENHRNHSDYKRLRQEDRAAYWNWRHDHP